MSFMDRVQNALISTVTSLVYSHSRARESRIFWETGDLEFGEDLLVTARSSDSVIVNSVPALDFAMPTSNKIAYIGGLTIQRKPEQLNMSNFFTAFSHFPEITFIVKYESTNCTLYVPPNVQLAQWIPQAELMGHPNYKAIITHGGLSSILETLSVGKPLILMPLFADHGKNSKVMEAKGAAIILDKMNLRVLDITRAIAEVTANASLPILKIPLHKHTFFRYGQVCAKLSRMLKESLPVDHLEFIDHLVRRAAKSSRKKFPLTPKEPQQFTYTYLQIFLGILLLFLTINS
ncbi:unnamed protein product [Strongylus vulgaris]|uniref:glucuronosyltransferase n=1 Tax=Strongylus vulgaris TaxID=40348 RepID=A0A3P7JHR1_STRVU|nr:unnamed protein product [Strongylus vulgaris]